MSAAGSKESPSMKGYPAGKSLKLLYKKNIGREQKAVWRRQWEGFGAGVGRRGKYILPLEGLLMLCVHPGRRTQQAKLGFLS